LGLIFTLGLPWAILAALVAPAKWIAALYIIGYLALRHVMAWTVGVWGVGDDVLRKKIWLVPLRDAIYAGVWLAGFASNRIHWGGEEFRILKGRLVRAGGSEAADSKAVMSSRG
jgi:hypothetical protein